MSRQELLDWADDHGEMVGYCHAHRCVVTDGDCDACADEAETEVGDDAEDLH